MLNKLKQYAGLLWMLLAVAAGYYLIISQAIPKFNSGKAEDLIPASIYAFILMPIITGGLLVFGFYALKGEYSDSTNSQENQSA